MIQPRLKHGCVVGMDQEGGGNKTVALLPEAVAMGMTTAANVAASFRRLFKSRIQLGMR